jgi:hypothetical protein
MGHDYWLRLIRRWLRNGYSRGLEQFESGGYIRHYIDRDGRLVRQTVEYLDPEAFAREHISADVISMPKQEERQDAVH